MPRRRSRAPPIRPRHLTSAASTRPRSHTLSLLVIGLILFEPSVLVGLYFIVSLLAMLRAVRQFHRALYESER